jgi:hypothetical protein
MPMFLEPYRNPWGPTLTNLVGGADRARAAATMASGQAIAAGAQQIGAETGATLNNLVRLKLDQPRREAEQIQLARLKRDEGDDQAARDAFTEAGGDPDAAVGLLEQKGAYIPAMKIRGQLQQQRVQALDVLGKQLKVNEDRLTQASQLLQGVPKAQDPATAYTNVLPQVRQLVGDNLGAKLPDQYDPNVVNTAVTWGMKAVDVSRMQRDAATAAYQGLRGAVTRVELQDRLTKSLATSALTAENQDDWDRIRQTASQFGDDAKTVLSKFPEQWSPALADTARTMLKPVESPTKYRESTVLATVNGKPTITLAGFDPERNAYFAPGETEHPLADARPVPAADSLTARDDAEIVKAVQANPAIWNDLTETVKSRVLPGLSRAGGFTPPPKTDRGASAATAERWRMNALKKVDDDLNLSVITADQATAQRAAIEQSYKVQLGNPPPSSATAPKPAGAAPASPQGPPAPKVKTGQALNLKGVATKVGKVDADGSWAPAMPTVVSVNGQRVKITKVFADGTFDGEIQQ